MFIFVKNYADEGKIARFDESQASSPNCSGSIRPASPTFLPDATNRDSICCRKFSGGFRRSTPTGCCSTRNRCTVRKTEEGRRMQTKDARPTPHPIRNAEPRYRAADYSADYLRDRECRPHGTVPARCLMEEEPTAGEATECPEFRETDRTAAPSTLRGRTRSAGYRMAFGPESGSRLRG